MRVRIITTASYPDGMASTSRIRCYAKALKNEGLDVEVVSTNGLIKKKGKTFLFKSEKENIPYTVLYNHNKKKNRWLNYGWASIKAFFLIFHTLFTTRRFDVCLIYVSDVWPKVLLLPFLKAAGKRSILELNEFPYATEGNKITKYPIIKDYLRWVSFKVVFPMVDGFLVISKSLENIVLHYVPKARILRIPILTEEFENSESELKKPIEYSNHYLFHAGSLSEQKDGIIEVFQAFAQTYKELEQKYGIELKFYITNKITQTDTWEKIKSILKQHDLEDYVEVTGYLSDEELKDYERGALALVINKPSSFQNQYNFPTKLSSYLSSGRPVVVAAKGLELNRYLKHNENALVVKPNDVKAIRDSIIKCYAKQDKIKMLIKNAYLTVRNNFYYKSQSERLGTFIKSL